MQTAYMETQVKSCTKEEERRSSELFELIMETEAQTGIKGFNVAGGGKEGIYIKQLLKDSPAVKKMELKEGDQLLSATVYFDNVKYEDAIKILQCAQPYKVSFCLKRTVPSNEVTVSSRSGSFEIKEQKAKMAKMAVKSITPVRKKKKAIIKNSRQASDEAPLQTSTEVVDVSSKSDITPAEVEFALPKFSKLIKGKDILGVEITHFSEVSDSDIKKKKLKFPRLKVKEVGVAKDMAVEPKQSEGQSTSSPANVKLETEDVAKAKDRAPIFALHFPKSKKVKADTSLPKGKGETSGLEIKEKMVFNPPDVETDFPLHKAGVSVLKPEVQAEGPHIKVSSDTAVSDVAVKEESFKTKFSKPNIFTKTQNLNIKDQEVEGSEGKLTIPNIRVPKVEISLPKGITEEEEDIVVSSAKQETLSTDQKLKIVDMIPSVEISASILSPKAVNEIELTDSNVADTATGGTGGTGDNLRLKMPSIGVFVKRADTDIVETKLQSEEEAKYLCTKGKIQMPEVKLSNFGTLLSKDKKESKLNHSIAVAEVESPESKHKAGLKLPSLEIAAPKVEVDIRVPRGKTETDIQPVDDSDELSEVKLKMPKVGLPYFGVTGSSTGVEVRQVPSKAEREMKPPHAESRKNEINGSNPKGPKGKLSSVEISLPKEKIEVSMPKVEGITIPDVYTKGKIAFVTAKMPSLDVSLQKVPDVDIELPKAKPKMAGPAAEGGFDAGGSEKNTDTDMPEAKFKIPKISLPYCDTSGKDGKPDDDSAVTSARTQTDSKAPAIKPEFKERDLYAADMQESKITLPKIDISLPKIKAVEPYVSVQHTSADISTAKSKINIITSKLDPDKRKTEMDIKDTELRLSFPSVKIQSLDISMPEIEIDIGSPSIKEGIKRLEETVEERFQEPDSKLQLAKVLLPKFGTKTKEEDGTIAADFAKVIREKGVTKLETEVTEIASKCSDIKVESSKVALPKLGFSFEKESESNITAVQSEIKNTDANLEAQSYHTEPETSGKKNKIPTIEVIHFAVSAPKILDMDTDITMQKDKMHANKGNNTDTCSPPKELGTEGVDAKWKTSKFALPKFGISGFKGKAAEREIKPAPTEEEIKSSDAKIKKSKLKMPTFGISLPKGKTEHCVTDTSNVYGLAEEVNLKVAKSRMKKQKTKSKYEEPEAVMSSWDPEGKFISVKLPKLDIAAPNVNIDIGLPKTTTDISTDGAVELLVTKSKKSSEMNIEFPDVKVKLPRFSMSKIGSKNKENDLEANYETTKGNVKVAHPNIETDIKFKTSSQNTSKLKEKKCTEKMPKIKMPFRSVTKNSDDCVTSTDISISDNDASVKVQKTKVDTKCQEADAEASDTTKTTFMKMPKLSISPPKTKIKEIERKVESEFKEEKVYVCDDVGVLKHKAELLHETEGIDSKSKSSKIKMPSLEISLPSGKPEKGTLAPNVEVCVSDAKVKECEGELKTTKFLPLDISVHTFDIDICLPRGKSGPTVDSDITLKHEEKGLLYDSDITASEIKLKMPKVELPKFKSKEKIIDTQMTEDKQEISQVTVPGKKSFFDVRQPEYEVDDKIMVKTTKGKMPKVDMPLPWAKSCDTDICVNKELPVQELKFKEVDTGDKFKLPTVELPTFSTTKDKALNINTSENRDFSSSQITQDTRKTKTDVKIPKTEGDNYETDVRFEGSKLEIKIPKLKMLPLGNSDTTSSDKEMEFNPDHSKAHTDKSECRKGEEITPKQERHIGLPHVELSMKGSTVNIPQSFSSPKQKPKTVVAFRKATDVTEAIDFEDHGGKFKIKVPEVDISFAKDKPDGIFTESEKIHSPDLTDMAQHKLKIPKMSVPEIGFSKSKHKIDPEPDTSYRRNIDCTFSDTNLDAYAKGPLTVDKTSTVMVSSPAKVGSLEFGLNMLNFNVPKVGISAEKTKKEGYETKNMEEESDEKSKMHLLTLPIVELSTSKLKENIDIEIKGPDIHLDVSDIKDVIHDAKIKIPKIALPSLGFSHSGIDKDQANSRETTGFKKDEELKYIKMSKSDISVPEIKAVFPERGPEKTNATKFPKIELTFPKGMQSEEVVHTSESDIKSDVEGADIQVRGKSKEMHDVVQVAHNDHGVDAGKMKIPKVKKGVFTLLNSGDKDADNFDIPEDSDMEDKDGNVLINTKPFEARLKIPKIKMKPTFGNSQPKSKGSVVNRECEVSMPKDGEEYEVKSSKLRFPKVVFSSSKTGSLDINVSGIAPSKSGLVGDEDAQASFQNGYKAKLDKITLPKVEFSTPYSKNKEGDLEMNITLVRTEDSGSEENINLNGMHSGKATKSSRISIPGFRNKVEIEPPTGIISSSASTEIVGVEEGDDKPRIKSPKSKIAVGFISSKAKENYAVETSDLKLPADYKEMPKLRIVPADGVGENEKDKSDTKEKSVKFKIPKFSLSPKSRGVLTIISGHPVSEQSFDCMQQSKKGEEASVRFKMQMPKIGFKTLPEEESSEKQLHKQEKSRSIMVSATKQIKTDSVLEKATTI